MFVSSVPNTWTSLILKSGNLGIRIKAKTIKTSQRAGKKDFAACQLNLGLGD